MLGVKKTSFMMSGMTMSSMSLVRNPQRPPSTPLLDPPFLTHFWLRYQYEIFRVSFLGEKRSFMTSWMTLSSMSLIRNPQRPLSTPLFDPPIPDTHIIKKSTRRFQGIFLGVKNIIQNIRNDPVLHVSDQELSPSSKYLPSWHPQIIIPPPPLPQSASRPNKGSAQYPTSGQFVLYLV